MVTNKTFNGVDYGSYSHGDRIGVAVVAGVYTVLALVALFGYVRASLPFKAYRHAH